MMQKKVFGLNLNPYTRHAAPRNKLTHSDNTSYPLRKLGKSKKN